jgi:hypothetical protein
MERRITAQERRTPLPTFIVREIKFPAMKIRKFGLIIVKAQSALAMKESDRII